MIAFVKSYPNHVVVLGFESSHISSIPQLSDLFHLFCRRHVDHLDLSGRLSDLIITNPLGYGFSETPCHCNIHKCVNKKCGCHRNGKGCSKSCLCMLSKDDKCKNPFTTL
jgi:hypothetical protein